MQLSEPVDPYTMTTVECMGRNRKQNATGRLPHRKIGLQRAKPFIAYDGEGYTSADGAHHYCLFGNSTGDMIRGNLRWRECVQLLMRSPLYAHHVIFSGTYDVVMLFKSEPEISALLHGKVVFMDQYRIQYLRGKMLRVTDRETKQTRTLYDVFSFFGTSLVKACREYIGDSDTLAEIEAMKLLRNTFTKDDILAGGVQKYMSQELELLVELCTTLRERLAQVDIHPLQWHGPGAVATSVLRREKVGAHKGGYTDDFRRVAESAYYGGRFEQFQRGTYLGKVYQYDIRSAYPSAMVKLPSLAGSCWEHVPVAKIRFIDPHSLYRVVSKRRAIGKDIGVLPYRSRIGGIYYPQWVNGWYWGIEIPPALTDDIQEAYLLHTVDSVLPFEFVESMYQQRAALKRASQPQQLALKLGLNCLYGKIAQSKGARFVEGEWVRPTFHEIVWAGLITAYTRRAISDAMHTVNPSHIIATETDSVFSTVPLPLQVGPNLGEWELTVLDGIKYIQSGVSLTLTDGVWSFKTRGFTVKRTEDEVEIWARFLESASPSLAVKQTRFGTDPRQKGRFGRWYETTHNLRLDGNPLEKRVHADCGSCGTGSYGEALHRLSVPPIITAVSTPYRFVWRDTGMLDEYAMLANLESDDPILKLEYVS